MRGALVRIGILLGAAALVLIWLSTTAPVAADTAYTPLRTGGDPFGVAIDVPGGRAYVTDSRENTLRVLDLATGQPLAFIPVGRQPNHVVLFAGKAYVSNFTDATITVVDTVANQGLRTLSIGGLGLALNPATGRLYAAGGSRLWVLDLATERLVATIAAPAGANLWGVAVDPASTRVYVTDILSPRVLVFDGLTNTLAGEIAIDAPSRFGIAAGSAGQVFVASYTDRNAHLSIIDGPSARVIAQVPVAPFTMSLAVATSGGLVYASSATDRSITTVDTATRSVRSRTAISDRTGALVVHAASGELFVVTAGGVAPPARAFAEPLPVVRP